MIADLDESDASELPEYDVCVVGSGPAGMTLAAELADTGLRVAVAESGKRRATRRGDRLRRVVSDGLRIKDYSRERVLGGASTTWAGLSSPLDPIDFQERPFLRLPGWPIERAELLERYREAAERYRFPALAAFGTEGPGAGEPDGKKRGAGGSAGEGFGALRGRGGLAPRWRRVEEKVFLAASEPQNFGRELAHVFEREGVDLYLDATALRLESQRAADGVEAVVLRASGGREVRLRSRTFVLACGGIENARLLLQSRDGESRVLGNDHDQVGRGLMNHPKSYCGVLELARPVEDVPYFFGCLHRGFAGYAGLRLGEAEQLRRGLLNSYVRLEPLFPWSDNEGVEGLILLVKSSRFLFRRWKARREEEVVTLRDYAETGDDSDLQNERKSAGEWLLVLAKIAANLHRVAQYLYFRLSRAVPRVRRVRLRNFMEMEPSPRNRVLLSDERDDYGQPVPLVRHACTELDKRSLAALHEVLAEEVAQEGLGRLDSELARGPVEPWPIDEDASHHMGTTRMGRDPRTSVVDAQCRVHGVPNLYVAGASVFPTSGCANPTFTIVALSIRLARHLATEVLPSRARERSA